MQQDLRSYYPPADGPPPIPRRKDDIRDHFERQHKKNKAHREWVDEDESSYYDVVVELTEEEPEPVDRHRLLDPKKKNVTLDTHTGIVTKKFPDRTANRDYQQADDFFANEADNDFIVPLVSLDQGGVKTRYLEDYVTIKDLSKSTNDPALLDAVREKLYEGFESLNTWYSDLANPQNTMVKIEHGRVVDLRFIEGGKVDHYPAEDRWIQWAHRTGKDVKSRLKLPPNGGSNH